MSETKYISSINEIMPDDFPTLTPLPEGSVISSSSSSASSSSSSSSNSILDYFFNVSWQTWLIIFLILFLLGINVFAYLAKGTQETASIFGPIMKFFGYNALNTTKQTIETSATGTKSGVDIVAGATTGAIDRVIPASNVQGKQAGNFLPNHQQAGSSLPVQDRIQQANSNIDEFQQDSLEKALSNASQSDSQVNPDDSRSSIQSTGKSGWCYIGETQGIRTCAEIGVNDGCMSGDVFPNQAICMNPNLRA